MNLIKSQYVTVINSLQNNQESQQPGYQNVTLPEPVYDQIYADRQPIPTALKDVKGYINQIQEEIEKFNEEYEVWYMCDKTITNTHKILFASSLKTQVS